MADTLLYVSQNYAALAATTLKTPLPTEDPDRPASNMLTPDRYLLYHCPVDDSSQVKWFLDLGSAKTIEVIGLHGYEDPLPVTIPNNVRFRASAVYPGSGGDWSDVGSPIPLIASGTMPPKPDPYEVLATPVTKRYWEVSIDTVPLGFSIGKTLLGDLTDLGIAYDRDSGANLIRNVTQGRGPGGRPHTDEHGPPRWRVDMVYGTRDSTQRDELLALNYASPIAIVHPFLGLMEIDLRITDLPITHRWKNRFALRLEAEQLP